MGSKGLDFARIKVDRAWRLGFGVPGLEFGFKVSDFVIRGWGFGWLEG